MNKEDNIEVKVLHSDMKFQVTGNMNNEGFAYGRLQIAYAGDNRNYSSIAREVFDKATPTLFGTPVVGNWLGNNFGGHDVIIETKGNEWIVRDKTIPLGFVPESSNVEWEEVQDDNGNTKLYITTDVVLWEHRFPEEVAFIRENGINHSMEIDVKDVDWRDDGYINIKDFSYNALCLLGVDTPSDPEGNVEPCFEDSNLELNYSKDFINELNAMKKAFNFTDNSQKNGGDQAVEITKEQYDLIKAELDTANEALRVKSEEMVKLEETYNALVTEKEAMEVELNELKEFKNSIDQAEVEKEIEEVKDQYSMLLDEKTITDEVEKFSTPTELRDSLARIYAQKTIEELSKSDNSDKKSGVYTFGRHNTATGSEDPYKIK